MGNRKSDPRPKVVMHAQELERRTAYALEHAVERFWKKVHKTETCWLWTGQRYATGYAAFSIIGVCFKAHRFAWELLRGPIPFGMNVLHRCDTPICVNPEHLFLGTQRDNVADMCCKGRMQGGENQVSHPYTQYRKTHIPGRVRKTHCKRGHEYTAANTLHHKSGSRYCRTCHDERMDRWNREHPGMQAKYVRDSKLRRTHKKENSENG